MKNKAYIFSADNCRIVTNPSNLEELRGLPNVVINPNLNTVKGKPTHMWKLVDGKVCLREPSEITMSAASEPPIPIKIVYKEVPTDGKKTESVKIVFKPVNFKTRLKFFIIGASLGALLAFVVNK